MSGNPYIQWFDDCGRGDLARVGGKNASLGELLRAGVRVPPGFAITTDAYCDFLTRAGLDRTIQRMLASVDPEDIPAVESTSLAIRRLMSEAEIPIEIERAVCDAYAQLEALCDAQDLPVAVRSSATAEDLPGASFAGQQETALWVRNRQSVIIRTAICWSSLFTPRAISYRARMGFPHEKVLISVGVQKMVNARTAGVLFTLNPINGDRSVIAIDASWGLGETVVSGMVTPDHFLVDKVTFGIIERTASPKLLEYIPDPAARRAEIRNVPPERQNCLCLSDEEVAALAELSRCIEGHYRAPMDVEWAIDADLPFPSNVMTLQSRPETVWSRQPARPVAQARAGALDYVVANLLAGVRTGAPRRTD